MMSGTKQPTKTRERGSDELTAEELAAMKDRAKEARAARRGAAKADGESDLLGKVAEMPEPDRSMAERLHAVIKAAAPGLEPRTWYGMPAYAKDGDVLCFFQPASKFKARFAMLGFSDKANLDDGAMWPAYYAIKELTPAVEAQIAGLLTRAAS